MITIDPDLCSGCSLCTGVCPHQVLAVQDQQAVQLAPDRCVLCGACALNCPEEAITVERRPGCLVMIIREEYLGLGGTCECC